jgi:hypothetical protein
MKAASADELERARQVCRLIAERGFARGRDLMTAMDAMRREMSGLTRG